MDVATLILPAQASMSVKAVWPMDAVASTSSVFPAASSLIRYLHFLLLFIVSELLLNSPAMDEKLFTIMVVIRVQNELYVE